MTKRRKPFRRPTNGPSLDRNSDRADDASADGTTDTGHDASGVAGATPGGLPPRERQTAEHHFAADELSPPPFATSFSKAANVYVDPRAYLELQPKTPDPATTEIGDPDRFADDPLILALRDDDASPSAHEIGSSAGFDFDPTWKLELPTDDAIGEIDEIDEIGEIGSDDSADPLDSAAGSVASTAPLDPASTLIWSDTASEDHAWPDVVEDVAETEHDFDYANDAAAQIDFLRAEVRRYQSDLERERLARTTAITAAQLAADARVEDLIRTQRHEREQLDLIHRQLLDAQRSEAEARRSALIEEHRRQRAKEHKQYQERVAELRMSTHQINQATSERFENQLAEAHATRVNALQSKLDEVTERADRLEAENREFRSSEQTWERQLSDAESSLTTAQAQQRETSATLSHQVQELQQRLARAEQRLNGERKRTSDLVSNLLRESAAVASQARNADEEITSLRASWATERDAVVAATLAEARAIERAAAEREAHLEATIGQLRAALHGVDSSTEHN